MADYKQYIDADPKVMLGKPKIKNTRITVAAILQKLADGYSTEEIIEMYPVLKSDQILAAVSYAAEVLNSETVIPAA